MMEVQRVQWDDFYRRSRRPSADPWLEPFSHLLPEGARLLDLGCGDGSNLDFLLSRSSRVHALDYSPVAIERVLASHPEVKALVADLRCPLPWADGSFAAVVADLSLHYFGRDETFAILRELSRVLVPEGVLLARVNSTKDVEHGAGRGGELEPGYFEHNGRRKRFFDLSSVEDFFSSSFSVLSVEETASGKYEKEKILWKIAARRRDTTT